MEEATGGRKRKREPLRQVQGGKAGKSSLCLPLPRLQVSWGPLEFRRKEGQEVDALG